MSGHTRGHALVAVDAGERGWLLHAGEATFDRGPIAIPADSPDDRANRRTIRAFERIVGPRTTRSSTTGSWPRRPIDICR
jgi:glyoxylase-like metal-dependent hydrolase (beta-lactamase superfamily II)